MGSTHLSLFARKIKRIVALRRGTTRFWRAPPSANRAALHPAHVRLPERSRGRGGAGSSGWTRLDDTSSVPRPAERTALSATHETLASFRATERSSSRKFGLTVGAILCALAVWPALRHGHPVRLWLLVPGLGLVLLGLVAPRLLEPLNRAWFRLGLGLARVTNPVVMGAMYVLAVVPIAWLIRRRGHDLLSLKREPDASTYWIARAGSPPAPLTKQY